MGHHSNKTPQTVEIPGASPSHGAPVVSFGAPPDEQMLILEGEVDSGHDD